MSTSDFFVKTNFEPQQKKVFKPYFSIKETGENIFRIAPACRGLAKSGSYAVYLKNHFGYKAQDQYNPDKTRHKPFSCIEKTNYKTKEVLQSCAECDLIAKELESFKTEKEALEKSGKSQEYVKMALNSKANWLKEHNLDKKWYCYAKNRAGEWNVLKIGHKVKLALDEEMKRLYKVDGINALDPSSGVWFVFTKNSGKGSQSVTNISVLREKTVINGTKVEILQSAPLTEDDVKEIEQLPDITNLTPVLSPDQVKALVASNGDPQAVASIFGLGAKNAAVAVADDEDEPESLAQLLTPPTTQVGRATPTPGTMTADEFLKQFAK